MQCVKCNFYNSNILQKQKHLTLIGNSNKANRTFLIN